MNINPKVRRRFIPASSVIIQGLRSKDSADKPVGTVSAVHKPPISMPILAVPRRAAPPRRKKESPKPSDEPPTEEEANVPEAEILLPESTSNLLAEAEAEEAHMPSDLDLKPGPTMESSSLAEDESPEPVNDTSLVTERSTSPTLVKSGDHEDIPEDARAPPEEDQPAVSLSEEGLAELVEEGQKGIEERSGIDQPELDLEEPLAEVLEDEEPIKLGSTAGGEDEHEVLRVKPDIAQDTEEQPEEGDEDEVTRRAEIAARLAKSGGFNPFAGGPPVRKPSDGSLPERRTSVETLDSLKPTVHEGQEPPAEPLEKGDVDPLNDETEFPTTDETEEDRPFDTLKRVEGDS